MTNQKRNVIIIILEAEAAETEKQFFDCLSKDFIEDLQNTLNINYIKFVAAEHCQEIKKKEKHKLTSLTFDENERYEIYFLIDRDCKIPTTPIKIKAVKKFLLENNLGLSVDKTSFNELMLPDGHSFEFVLCMAFPYETARKFPLKKLIKNYELILINHGPFEKERDWKKKRNQKRFSYIR